MTLSLSKELPSPIIYWSEFATVQFVASFFGGLALQDYHNGDTAWIENVTQAMPAYIQRNSVYGNPSNWSADANYWSLAFYYAYRTYKQEFLLDTAVNIYEKTYLAYFITPSDAASGTGAGRNVSFNPPPSCLQGVSSDFSINGS